jgi:hypothetical protein
MRTKWEHLEHSVNTESLMSQRVAPNPQADADRLEAAADQAIAACGGDVRDALEALIVANEYLESEVCELMQAVSHAYARGRLKTYTGRAAAISGTPATPKGLHQGLGVKAFQSNVPPHLVQRGRGHASLRTTAVYSDVIGPEERAFAARKWGKSVKRPDRALGAFRNRIGRISPRQ